MPCQFNVAWVCCGFSVKSVSLERCKYNLFLENVQTLCKIINLSKHVGPTNAPNVSDLFSTFQHHQKQNKTKQNKTKQNKTKQNKNKTKHNKNHIILGILVAYNNKTFLILFFVSHRWNNQLMSFHFNIHYLFFQISTAHIIMHQIH